MNLITASSLLAKYSCYLNFRRHFILIFLAGKGANTVISLIHHALEHYSFREEELHLHADNCLGQNKNNANLQVNKLYFMLHNAS